MGVFLFLFKIETVVVFYGVLRGKYDTYTGVRGVGWLRELVGRGVRGARGGLAACAGWLI
jgi:hypothetical protein